MAFLDENNSVWECVFGLNQNWTVSPNNAPQDQHSQYGMKADRKKRLSGKIIFPFTLTARCVVKGIGTCVRM